MYYVGYNMPGYMPDNEPQECETLEEAKECLATEVTHYIEEINLDSEYSDEQVREWSKELERLDKEPAQECNFYAGVYVFYITEA